MAKTPWEMAEVGSEFSHQSALFAWAAMARNFGPNIANYELSYRQAGWAAQAYRTTPNTTPAIPELKWLHAIKNQGHGDRVRGSRSKSEGVREGVFDVFLPVSMYHHEGWRDKWPLLGGLEFEEQSGSLYKTYCGLYIELKTPDRKNHKNGGASDPQLEFQAFAREQGYAAELAHGWLEARDLILKYLGKG